MGLEISDLTAVLIDRMTISGIEIVDILDYDKLVVEDIIQISSFRYKYTMADGRSFSRLEIKSDGIINRFSAGALGGIGFLQKYCICEFCIPGTDNLNCFSYSQYIEEMRKVMQHLEDYYGIVTDYVDCTIKYIELNKTFYIDYPFDNYHRILDLFLTRLPKTFHYNSTGRNELISKMYSATTRKKGSDRYRELKIYDKTADLLERKGKAIDKNIMRVELILSDTSVIKQALGSAKFFELNQKAFTNYYHCQMHKLIYNKMEQWKKESLRKVNSMVNDLRRQGKRYWISHLLQVLQDMEIKNRKIVILDVNDIYPIFNKEGRKRRYQIKESLKKHAESVQTAYFQRDDLKMQELLEKILTPNDHDA